MLMELRNWRGRRSYKTVAHLYPGHQIQILFKPPTTTNMAMKALILDAAQRTVALNDIPKLSPGPGEILVRIETIALNPIDPLYVEHPLARSGRTVGSDFAGIIASFGSEVPATTNLEIGDRVAGFLQGACSVNDRPGAFAEYAVIPWDLVWKIPEKMSVEQAAGVSLVSLTAAQGMWFRLGLQAPFELSEDKILEEHPEWVAMRKGTGSTANTLNFFIYGASTSVGLYAAQMVRISAKKSGQAVRLFGAASKSRWNLLKSEPYSYDILVDYRDEDWPEQIRKWSDGRGMQFAYDCISEGTSVARVASTLSVDGNLAIVRSRQGGAWKAESLPTEPVYGAVWEGLGEAVEYQGFTVKQSPAAREFAVEYYKWLSQAAGSELIPVPIRIMPGGLDRVAEDGFRLLGAGSMTERSVGRSEEWMRPVSAEKLVYRI